MTGYAEGWLKVWPPLVKISGWLPLSPDLAKELELRAMGPVLGPPLPASIELRRRLGGHPFGAYRRAA